MTKAILRTAITGGIGSGKSFVCQLLQQRGIDVYDCDAAAKRLMRDSEPLRQQLTRLIGPDTYRDGQLNKAAVEAFMMQSEENTLAVNHLVHPAVFRDFLDSGKEWVESAILFESGLYRYVDRAVCVTAPEEVRIQRVMERDGISRQKTLEWMAKQMPQEEVLGRCDFEIVNDGQHDLAEQVDRLLDQIKNITQNNNITRKEKMQLTILSIAGKPGLYKLVSRGKANLIVEALDETHKRMPAFATDRVTSLADIAMYTDAEDVPLMTILAALRDKEEGKPVSFNYKKASSKELRDFFADRVLPSFDQDRVHDSDIRKLLQWYNILIKNEITNFEEQLSPTEGDNVDDRMEKE